jgi:hypothetical protein
MRTFSAFGHRASPIRVRLVSWLAGSRNVVRGDLVERHLPTVACHGHRRR